MLLIITFRKIRILKNRLQGLNSVIKNGLSKHKSIIFCKFYFLQYIGHARNAEKLVKFTENSITKILIV